MLPRDWVVLALPSQRERKQEEMSPTRLHPWPGRVLSDILMEQLCCEGADVSKLSILVVEIM